MNRHKKSLGDIDIFIPSDKIDDLHCILDDSDMGQFEIVGTRRLGSNISMLVHRVHLGHFQIDFIPATFVNGRPSAWDRFAHSSAWIDIKRGFKGSMHKIALSAIAGIPAVFGFKVNAKGEKHHYGLLQKYSFGVGSGYRLRHVQTSMGHFREIASSETTCTRDVSEIFEKMFGSRPTFGDMKKFYSFVGLCELVKKHFDFPDQKSFVAGFVERLYGDKARTLGQTWEADSKIKDPAILYIANRFPHAFEPINLLGIRDAYRAKKFKEELNENGVLSGEI